MWRKGGAMNKNVSLQCMGTSLWTIPSLESGRPPADTNFVLKGLPFLNKDDLTRQLCNKIWHKGMKALVYSGFVWVPKNLESPGILFWHFPGLENPGKRLQVLESHENLLNSCKAIKFSEFISVRNVCRL